MAQDKPQPTAPSPLRQVGFHRLLVAARKMWLADAMASALGTVDQKAIKRELAEFAPHDALAILAKAGIRDEHIFPTPTLLIEKPTLIGYYRLLLGSPQKTFYGSGTGMGQFKTMEGTGTITHKQKQNLPAFCKTMCEALADLVRQISPHVTLRDVAELPLLTLGSQIQGANNNRIGQEANRGVFLAINEIVVGHIVKRTANEIVVKNAARRRVVITLASDPDVRIEEEASGGMLRKKVAIETKGGTDKSNAHNRAGESEKSHQKAKNAHFVEFWTLIALKGLKLSDLKKESPTTTAWFDVAHVLAREGIDWQSFREHVAHAVGIPTNEDSKR